MSEVIAASAPQPERPINALRAWIGGTIAVAVVIYFAWWAWLQLGWHGYYGTSAKFADSISPVTGLFSVLALAAAVVSVRMQQQELELQREEMRQTREVLAEQTVAQEKLAEAQGEANKIAADLVDAQKRANTIAKAQLELDNQKLRWETDREIGRAERDYVATEATLIQAAVRVGVTAELATDLQQRIVHLLSESQKGIEAVGTRAKLARS